MNRSIFQIKLDRWLYSLFFIIIFVIFWIDNNSANCVSFRNGSYQYLKEINYNNIIFKCNENVSEADAIFAVDNFLLNRYYQNLNFSIAKYFEIKNGITVPFDQNTCYAHPNLFFGVYNNLYFNFQFSHKIYNHNFCFFTSNDMVNGPREQYLCNQFYIYDSILKQQFLNYLDLGKNQIIAYNQNLGSKLIQNYINVNNFQFNLIVKKSFNI